MKRRISSILMASVLGVSLLSGCSAGSAPNVSTLQTKLIKSDSNEYMMAGKIEANENIDITSKITAKVEAINVEVGSNVKEGDVIIKLDSKDLNAQVAEAQAGVETANANLAKIQNGARPEEITKAQAAASSAKATYDNAKENYDRNVQLFNKGAISQSQLEQYKTELANAEGSYKSYEADLEMLINGETQETIKVAQSQVEQAQAALNLAKVQLNNGIIVSPISGVVSSKNVSSGELAEAGSSLVTIVNSDALYINAYLPESLMNRVKIGQEVAIKVSNVSNKVFNGKILVINPVIDSENKNELVKIKFETQDPLLKPGMFAEIALKN
ncbi:efflux RND transporter periplasmic adaptor subunit [Clostridium sp. PL3]|uniref:Efflux RND transporter periplasmic adaptor subunit n=1 Tax=Clostridium thailandense TaxID=2794346 RepID=A0A949U5T2_9CLOT|nr:efflux RND transporter periplasmic adaptor subunit [Clostridium thailandense]MBV7276988.1 efflux RND transporter periplasmic adaptor subunit [Clostridium thailandense]